MAQCAIDGCGYPTRWGDLCNAHSVRLHRTGVRGGEVQRRGPRPVRLCSVDGCEDQHYCQGMCTLHYQQVRNRGQLDPPRITGPDHHSWLADSVAYRTVHTRLVSYRGPASANLCVDCSQPAEHWSYDHHADVELIERGLRYTTDLDHYDPRCRSCHKRFDLDRADSTAQIL